LRNDSLRVALLATLAAILFGFAERGRVSEFRTAPLLAAVIFLDVFTTTTDLAWIRPSVMIPRPSYLPEMGARGTRVMRLKEITQPRLALNDSAYSEEQLRQAALLSPMVNLPLHVALLDPYGYYFADVGQAMAELAKAAPLALAQVTATDVILAAPTARAPWLEQAVDSHRLLPTHAIAAGAVALHVEQPLPRSFLTRSASLRPRAEIPHDLVRGLDRVFLTSDKALVGGTFVTLPPSFVPTELLSTPSQQPVAIEPTAWRPGAASYRTSADAPSLLVEVDAFAPGWRVFVDGHEQPILQANVFGRAVVVPAGSHSVEWMFAPRLVIAGMFASWFGLALALLLLFWPKKKRILCLGDSLRMGPDGRIYQRPGTRR
jgi:hypothetical protein